MIKTPLSTVIGGAFWTPSATVIGGSTPTFDQQIQKLFANGEQGFFYDPNDLTTMFQDAAGTVPVTAAGQPVWLMLDKSRGMALGDELITGGNFESNLIGTKTDGSGSVSTWTLNTSNPISGTQDGRLTIITPSFSLRPFLQLTSQTKTAGRAYSLSFDYKVLSGSPIISFINTGTTAQINKLLSGNGKFTANYIATSALSSDILYFGNQVGDVQIDNISVKEIKGNHAYQTTSSMRPLLVASPQRLDYDTVDDKLVTTLPAQLTGCTVVRAVPNVGTQILTGQTIPATYEDNKDHCGLIVINRALTASETSQITKLFNKAAGV